MLKIKLSILCAASSYRRHILSTILAGVVASLIVAGCGYHLSGTDDKEYLSSPLLKSVSIEGVPRYDTFRIQLERDLLSYQIKVVKPESATTKITIENKKIEQQAITLGDDAKVREYLLIAQLNFSVTTAERQYPAQSIQSETTYAYYPQQISISANEKKRALASLNRDMSLRLIDRIRALTNQK